jgi:vitamin B12/bleomycin/antimicrobial peptide transport system ATP-binding/permease protein
MGVINQGVGAFARILTNLSIVIDAFEDISQFSAGIERLASFYEAMRRIDSKGHPGSSRSFLNAPNLASTSVTTRGVLDPDNALVDSFPPLPLIQANVGGIDSREESFGEIDLQRWNDATISPVLQIENLLLVTPDRKRILINNLTVQLDRGQHLLIVGNSGAGKSSLLRAIAGLWTAGNGMIGRPAEEHVYFLPQRPYCTMGSLKDQLLYPCSDESDVGSMDTSSRRNGYYGLWSSPKSREIRHFCSDMELLQILEKIDLLDVATRAGDGDPTKGLAAVTDWSNILSLGEQQRLAFGRLLVNRPSLIILDEATSALDLASEARMYGILQDMASQERPAPIESDKPWFVTYISVGHRPSLHQFHDRKLHLGGDSNHVLSIIEPST